MFKALLLSIASFFVSCGVKANTYYVTNASDTGVGSLRAMMDSANLNPGMDTVLLSLGVHDTIHIGSRLPPITDSILISGQPCQNPVIDGNFIPFVHPAFFCVSDTIPVTINYLNIFNCKNVGAFGAGAVQAGQLYLDYCFFYGNIDSSAGSAAYAGAVLSTNLTASNSTFCNNSSQIVTSSGAGAISSSNGYLSNCTFTGNTSQQNGGALNGTFYQITNCTITGNYAADSGGGIFSTSNAIGQISNNIIWGNTIGNNALQATIGGISFASNINSAGCNILQDASGSNFFTLTVTDVHGVDPQMSTVGYYSGCVPVQPFLCGSVAKNHAGCAGATIADAEGILAQGVRDAGAFELTNPVLGGDTIDSIQQGTTASLYNYFNTTGYTIKWPAGINDSSAAAVDTGTYVVIATNAFGCSDTATAIVLYATDTLNTGLMAVISLSDFKIFPDPVKDVAFVTWDNGLTGELVLKINDMLGRIVLQQSTDANTGKFNLNISNLISGVYLVSIQYGKGNVVSGKLIVSGR